MTEIPEESLPPWEREASEEYQKEVREQRIPGRKQRGIPVWEQEAAYEAKRPPKRTFLQRHPKVALGLGAGEKVSSLPSKAVRSPGAFLESHPHIRGFMRRWAEVSEEMARQETRGRSRKRRATRKRHARRKFSSFGQRPFAP
jgi:hypothetical protein